MISKNVSHYVQTSSATWKISKIPGVQYIPLHTDVDEKFGTFVLKMSPGSTYPRHRHPGGEEIFVLKGELSIGDQNLTTGDYVYSSPGSIHQASTKTGCIFLKILSKPITIIPQGADQEFETITSSE